jgi:hypothetical protein
MIGLVPDNGSIAVHEFINILGISFGSVYSILKNSLNMWELLQNMCPAGE